jgi:hypothetical protein
LPPSTNLSKVKLSDLVNDWSIWALETLRKDYNALLDTEVEDCALSVEYQTLNSRVNSLAVTNDRTVRCERLVLMSEINVSTKRSFQKSFKWSRTNGKE